MVHDRNLTFSKDEEKDIWKNYLKKLFYDERERHGSVVIKNNGPGILKEQTELAIKQMEEGKAALDQIKAEFYKILDKDVLHKSRKNRKSLRVDVPWKNHQ